MLEEHMPIILHKWTLKTDESLMAWQQFLKESNNPVQALPTTWLNFPGGSDSKAFAYNAGDPG